VALVPLGRRARGLLALGSNDRDRFHPAMSTEFLRAWRVDRHFVENTALRR